VRDGEPNQFTQYKLYSADGGDVVGTNLLEVSALFSPPGLKSTALEHKSQSIQVFDPKYIVTISVPSFFFIHKNKPLRGK
jgi:hypothetical protein